MTLSLHNDVISTKFLGVHIDENSNWMQHITLTENKTSKQQEILYKAKPYLNHKSMVRVHYLFIHTYLSYSNTEWTSKAKTKLNRLYSQQK